jgi:hypothetical protein
VVRADNSTALTYLDHLVQPPTFFCRQADPTAGALVLEDFEASRRDVHLLADRVRREATLVAHVRPRAGDTSAVYRHHDRTVWVYEGDERTAEGPNVVVRDGHRITAFTAGDDRYRPMQSARLLREIALRHAENQQWVTFHSAVVTVDGHGILIVGARGAGKTTTALSLCRWAGAALAVNDRALLRGHEHGITAVPFAQPVRVLDESLRLLGLDSSGWRLLRPRRKPHHKYQLLHGEIGDLLDVPLAAESTISAVVTPVPDEDGGPVTRDVLRRILVENCYTPSREPTFVDDWLELRPSGDDGLEGVGTALVEALLGLPHLTLRHTNADGIRSSILDLRRRLSETLR